MRKIILDGNISLDGFMAGPNGELDQFTADEDLHRDAAQLLDGAGTIIFGRVTYQMMEDYWPAALKDDSLSEGMKAFARAYDAIPKTVFSRTLEKTGRNTRIIRELHPEEVREMKQQPGKDFLIAAGELAYVFMEHGLIDEYRLWVHPLLLGSGKRLFKDGAPLTQLALIEAREFASGVVLMHFRRN
jgi:dihydrofolate reductase